MRLRTFAGSLARSSAEAAPPRLPRRWAFVAGAFTIVVVAAFVLWWQFVYDTQFARGVRAADAELDAGAPAYFLSDESAHVDEASGLVVAQLSHTIYCYPGSDRPNVEYSYTGGAQFAQGWNHEVRRRLAEGSRLGPRFDDRVTTLTAVRERFARDGAGATVVPEDGYATLGDRRLRWWTASLVVGGAASDHWFQPVGGAPQTPALERASVFVLPAADGRTAWVRAAPKDGSAPWYFVVDLATGTNFQVFEAKADESEKAFDRRPAVQARRYLDHELRRGRGCLLSQDWAHVDPETGLVVAKTLYRLACGDEEPVHQSPGHCLDPKEYADVWNAEIRRRLAAGETVGPRFADRITTLDAVRERFRKDGASAAHVGYGKVFALGGKELRWWHQALLVRDVGATEWTEPVGGAPGDPGEGADAVFVLRSEDGRTLFARFVAADGSDAVYSVVDASTGTHLYVFPVAPR